MSNIVHCWWMMLDENFKQNPTSSIISNITQHSSAMRRRAGVLACFAGAGGCSTSAKIQ